MWHPGAVLIDDLKARITVAVKSGDTLARDILRLALGELQMGEVRKNAPLTEAEAETVLRKLIKANEETIGLAGGEGARADALRKEIAVLASILPKQMTVDDIVFALTPNAAEIRAAQADGQATGIAMKLLKAQGAVVSGNDVGAAVKLLRSRQPH